MEIGCYSMHLYCDHRRTCGPRLDILFPFQYTGETNAECKRKAKSDGWKFKRDGTHICPHCVKEEF